MKKEMRRYFKAQRNRISEKDKKTWDKIIRNRLFSTKIYKKSKTIFTYYSMKDEVDTIEIIKKSWQLEKEVYIPKIIDDGRMIPVLFESFDDLVKGKYNIPTSKNTKVKNNIDLCLVPGYSFDKNKYRIGYGGGFYDDFIKKNESFYLGLFYDITESFKLDLDIYDQKLDMIITDKNIVI